MKLYMHTGVDHEPSHPLFIAEQGPDVDEEVVDLFSGAHHQEPFVSINPAGLCLCSRTATSG